MLTPAITLTLIIMAGLLSLPNVLIELVVEQVIGNQQLGLKDWCRAASTCKRLRGMQLPAKATAWCVNLDSDIKGESETRSCSLCTVICHACASILTLARAGAPWVIQRIQSAREIVASRRAPSRLRFSHLPRVDGQEVLHQTLEAMARASQRLESLTTLVCPLPSFHDALQSWV